MYHMYEKQQCKTIYFFISSVKKLMFEVRNLNRLQKMTFIRNTLCMRSNYPYLEVSKRTIVAIYMGEEQHIIMYYRHFKAL